MWFRLTSIVLSLIVVSIGCSNETSVRERDERVIGDVYSDDLLSDNFFMEDRECQLTGIAQTPTSIVTRSMQFGSLTEIKQVNPGFNVARVLTAPGIAETTYGTRLARTCLDVGNDATCQGKKIIASSSPLSLCRDEASYSRQSVEGIAVTSAAHVVTAYNFYQSIPGSKKDLPLISLNILPIDMDEAVDGEKRAIKTDNLSYFSDFGGKPLIAIYPKSRSAALQGKWNGFYLWEVPWAVIHEFGHHVMSVHQPAPQASSSSLHDPSTLSTIPTSSRRIVRESDVVDAVSEGFADLFAHFATGAKPGQLAGVDCVASKRDPSSKFFANMEAKLLSREVLQQFFLADGTSSGTTDCNQPRYNEPHTMGASIAYSVNALFEAAAIGVSQDEFIRLQFKGEQLLKWANEIGKIRAQGTGTLNFPILITPTIKNIRDGQYLPTETFCQKVGELFSGIKSQLGVEDTCPEFKAQ